MPGPAVRTLPRSDTVRGLSRFLERERLVVAVVAIYATVGLIRLPLDINQDGWLALVSGRLIADHGIPHHDVLTVWSAGDRWVDQQWLAQLVMYALHSVGGLRLMGLFHVALIVSAVVVALAVARRRAAPLTVMLVAFPALGPIMYISGQVRTQGFGVALFAVVLALLLADARAPSRRVWLVLPLLALWTNLHGSEILGAGLVLLRALSIALPERSRANSLRAGGLAVGAVAATFASPYAADMPWYYSHTALNPLFGSAISEWVPTTLGVFTVPFYALLILTTWAVGRRWHLLGLFEKLVLLATGVGGLLTLRYTGWFGLAALMIVPAALDADIPALAERSSRAARLGITFGPIAALGIALLVTLVRPQRSFERRYPATPEAVVARVAAANPSARIFADVRFGDWLLWRDPQLVGRIAFDARFELLSHARLLEFIRWSRHIGDEWRRAPAGYDVVVLDRSADAAAESGRPTMYHALLSGGGFRIGYVSAGTAVLVRDPRPAAGSRS